MPEDQSHRGIVGLEQRAAGRRAQARDQFRLGGADAAIDLVHAEPEIEQQRAGVLRTQRPAVRADLGQHRAAVHRASRLRQAERDTLAPGTGRDRLERDRTQVGTGLEPHAAARRHDRNRLLGLGDLGRLVRVTHEFRDGAESAETPLRIGIGDLRLNQLERTRHFGISSARANRDDSASG